MKAITQDFALGRVLEEIYQHCAQALAAASRGALEPGEVALALAPAHAEGDLAFRCFELARAWKKNPALIAQEMVAPPSKPGGVKPAVAVKPEASLTSAKALPPWFRKS